MQAITSSIANALESKNYFGALFMALTIPDICGYLETPQEQPGKRYRRWFSKNLKYKYFPDSMYDLLRVNVPDMFKDFPDNIKEEMKQQPVGQYAFTDNMCWKLRNSVLHTGSSFSGKLSFHLTNGDAHCNVFDGVLQISVTRLCKDICDAFDKWADENKNNKDIQARLAEGMRIQNEISPGLVLE